ncbi:MAG: methylated-DNA--[protein]-cysteine S-methyltransferase [Bacilli bacterium]
MTKHYMQYSSPLGPFYLLSDGDALIFSGFETQLPPFFKDEKYASSHNLKVFIDAKNWLDNYFDKKDPGELPPFKFIEGTDFQKSVWQELINIPYRELRTYKQIGEAVKKTLKKDKVSYRAVGHAVGQNPLSIFVPCHRVIGSNNSLVGYAGGLHLKEALLQLEGRSLDKFKR